MSHKLPAKHISNIEFVTLMAFLTSLTALSIDSILPALAIISEDLNLAQAKESQQIIVTLFLGMAFGQFIYGPLADSIGRKPSIYIGISLFLIGSVFTVFANTLDTMLWGRFLQGLGVASPRIITMAIVRDCYSGKYMARIMSFMMSIFIIIPIVAPTLGYWILVLSNWRMIYVSTAIFSLIVLIWFTLRQRETLKEKYKQPFKIGRILDNIVTILKTKGVLGYTVMSGLIFGAFLSYLSASQHIFQNIYNTGSNFPYYFAALAASLGVASFLNAKWVLIFNPKVITRYALMSIIILNAMTYMLVLISDTSLNLIEAMIYFTILFFLVGLLFGNINALAMEPIGHLAGIGAGVIGSISTFISVPLASFIGDLIDININYFILGFLICSVLSLFIMLIINHKTRKTIT